MNSPTLPGSMWPRFRLPPLNVAGFLSEGYGEFFPPKPIAHLPRGVLVAWDRNIDATERRVKIVYPSGSEVIFFWRLLPVSRQQQSMAEFRHDDRPQRSEEFRSDDGHVYPNLRAAVIGARDFWPAQLSEAS